MGTSIKSEYQNDINKLQAEINNIKIKNKELDKNHNILVIEHCKIVNMMLGIKQVIKDWEYSTDNIELEQDTNKGRDLLEEFNKKYEKYKK